MADRFPVIADVFQRLKDAGEVRTRTEGTTIRVARPAGHFVKSRIDIDSETGKWTDVDSGWEGTGVYPALRHLGIFDLSVIAEAIGVEK